MATKQEELTVKTPIGDWGQEYAEEEVDVSTEEKLVELMTKKKVSAAKAARLAIVAREVGAAPEDIIPPNKLLLNAGGALSIQSLITQRYREAQLPNGETVMVREFVAPVRSEPESGQEGDPTPTNGTQEDYGLVGVESEAAHRRALDYLLKIVPGHIHNRLVIIAINRGDVTEAAGELKKTIDEMVTRFG